jgi:hypothetical protein
LITYLPAGSVVVASVVNVFRSSAKKPVAAAFEAA